MAETEGIQDVNDPEQGQAQATDAEQQGSGSDQLDPAALRDLVKELRAQAAKYRVQRNEFRDKLEAYEAKAKMSGTNTEANETQQQTQQPDVAALVQQAVEQAIAPLQKRLDEAEQAWTQAEQAAQHATIRAEFKLPEFVRSLQGNTPEELRQDAKQLAEALQSNMPQGNVRLRATNPANGEVPNAAQEIYEMRSKGFASAGSIFPVTSEGAGGFESE